MIRDSVDLPEKVRRNDPCPCGSGEKYKKCCMKKTNSGMKGVSKKYGTAFVRRLILDNLKKVPIISSAVGAAEDIQEQKEKEEENARLSSMQKNISATMDFNSKLLESAPILDSTPSLSRTFGLANLLQSSMASHPKYDVEIVSTDKNKNGLRIAPKTGHIEFNIKLKSSTQRFGNLSTLKEFIENEIKEGRSVSFSEDEIAEFTFLDEEIHRLWDSQNSFREIIFKPETSKLPYEFSFIVENTEIAYHNVDIGSIYTNGKEATLVTMNLPFEILIKIRENAPKLTFNFNVELGSISVLDLDKFWDFLIALNNGYKLQLKDSKRGTVFLETLEKPTFDINTDIATFTKKLAKIDRTFNTDFMYPEEVTDKDLITINDIVFIIENKYLKISDVKVSFIPIELDKLIAEYEKKGYFENLFADIPVSYDLFGKTIDMGKGRIFFKKAFIRENIEQLKKEMFKKQEIDMTFVSADENARLIF